MKRGMIAAGMALVLGLTGWWVWHRRDGQGAASGSLVPTAPLYQAQDLPMDILVYYATADGSLEPEKRMVYRSAERLNQMKQTLLEAFKPPQLPGHTAVIPEGVTLRELYVDRSFNAFLDCSAELAAKHPGGSSHEWLTVQALTACLMKNFEEIKSVQLLINGQTIETLKGHVDLTGPFVVEHGLLKPLPEPVAVPTPAP